VSFSFFDPFGFQIGVAAREVRTPPIPAGEAVVLAVDLPALAFTHDHLLDIVDDWRSQVRELDEESIRRDFCPPGR